MNYGKIAYLKTLDLEQRLGGISPTAEQGFLCSEYSYDAYNRTFTNFHEIDYDGLAIRATSNVCLQSKIRINATVNELVKIKVIVNENEIGYFDQMLIVGICIVC